MSTRPNAARRKARFATYKHLGAVYKLLCAAFANSEIMRGMKFLAEKKGIATASTTSTALLFVKLLSNKSLELATASQQAMALRGAALQGVAPEEFALRVPELGGIAKLAEHFRAQRHPSAPKTDKLARKTPPVKNAPELRWSKKAIDRWKRHSSKNERVHLTVRRTGQNRGTVIDVFRSLTETGEHHGL